MLGTFPAPASAVLSRSTRGRRKEVSFPKYSILEEFHMSDQRGPTICPAMKRRCVNNAGTWPGEQSPCSGTNPLT